MQIGEFASLGYSRKNVIINGDFNIWQRATSFAAVADGTYTADRFRYHKGGTMVHTISRDTDVPTVAQAGVKFNYSLKLDCTTAQASLGSTEYVAVYYYMEGFDFSCLQGKTATLSFWIKSANKTGVFCVNMRDDASKSFIGEYTVNATNTWEKKTVVVSFTVSGGTWNYDTAVGLRLAWHFAIGSAYVGVPGWQDGIKVATSSAVNGVDNVANDFWITGVQFEVGNVPTDFEGLHPTIQTILCQRYFEKSYDIDVAPNTGTEAGLLCLSGFVVSDTACYPNIRWKVPKRILPVRTFYYQNYTINGGAWTSTTLTAYTNGKEGCLVGKSGLTAGNRIKYILHYTANAEF